jgi:hypothetical protein
MLGIGEVTARPHLQEHANGEHRPVVVAKWQRSKLQNKGFKDYRHPDH